MSKEAQILPVVKEILLDLSGFDLDELDQSATFLELGFDSLFLIQFSQVLKKKFKVKVTFRQLIEQIGSFANLIQYIDEKVPDGVLPEAAPPPPPPAPAPAPPQAPATNTAPAAPAPQPAPAPPPMPATPPPAPQPQLVTRASGSGLEAIMSAQLDLMAQQLQLLQGRTYTDTPQPQPAQLPANNTAVAPPSAPTETGIVQEPPATTKDTEAEPTAEEKKFERYGPYKPVKRGKDGGLTESQQKHLDALIDRFNARTPESKRLAQHHRPHLADPRAIAGFRTIWKEMVYQIHTVRSAGSKIWDVDDNEYVDIAMGFGLNLFGHSPDFIREPMRQQLEDGIEIAPQTPLAGEVAQMLCQLTNMDRATFCNTGSEAVTAAIRIARTITGRDKIAFFAGSYHGNFDQVLVRANVIGNKRRMSPAAPGVPQSVADETLVLDYGEPESLELIRQHADELAAVLVEPAQSSQLDLQPREFLHELRQLSKEHGIVFVMDEVITGFRAAPGGSQEWFGVEADLATFGKILGGGLPIGALAGKQEFMDALDSGMWQYGDDSIPAADMTFFAGTFVRHPLALSAARAVLQRVIDQGPALQEELTQRTKALVDELNNFFVEVQVPIRIRRFCSQFRFNYPPDLEYVDLLYYHLLEKGIFTRGFLDNCFVSTAHTDADLEKFKQAVKSSVLELQEAGFLPKPDTAEQPSDFFPSRQSDKQRLPLTEAQSEIWLVSQMSELASCSFNEPFTLRLKGDVDVPVLRTAVQTAVDRHEAFNLRFARHGDAQVFGPRHVLDIPVEDLRQLSPAEQATAVTKASKTAATTPFDLENGPLIRVRVLQLAADDYVLVFSGHHIVCDGWSWNVLLNDIAKIYNATHNGRVVALPPAGSYADYVHMELEEQASPEIAEAYQYWLDLFADLPPALELPTDRPRPPRKTYTGGSVTYHFRPAVYENIKRVAAEQGASLFSMLYASFNILLARLSGQNDLVVTVPTAGQVKVGEPELIGHCINLLPVRNWVNHELPFNEFLSATTTAVLDAYDHQECTMGGIIKRLNLPRNASRMPLAEINFNLDRDGAGLSFDNLAFELEQVPRRAVNFDIFFNLNEIAGGLMVDCDYNTDLYDAETITRWCQHYEILLAEIAQQPTRRIADLPVMSPAERDKVLLTWNETAEDYPRHTAVHTLFEQQVAKTPDNTAVVYEGHQLTYRELNQRANQLARHLQAQGVRHETLVGISLTRSEWMIIGLLGILKAGGTYVPMDPTYPPARLAHMVTDSGMGVVLTESELSAQLPVDQGIQTILIDSDWSTISQQTSDNLEVTIDPQQLAYVIYTSGSTGKPKGVQLPHRALTNFLCTMQKEPGLTVDDKIINVTTLSFDIAGLEIYLPLITGAELLLISQETAADGFALADTLQEEKVTVMQATPATWQMLLETGWAGQADLKMLCGGEALPPLLAEQLLAKGGELWNMYGPTETTIWSAVAQIKPTDELITIGRPIANTQLYILNDNLQPVPVGSVGTLYIGGDGLARGYLDRPELTAKRFVDNPFGPGRIYNTGDRARYLPDGRVQCLGRVDYQVKIRGFRIELGEIETVLTQHTAVQSCVALVREDIPGDKRLAAYLIVNRGYNPTVDELRQYMRQHLPEYMVPANFVMLEAFPLTPNGKVNRLELPSPLVNTAEQNAAYNAPRTDTERTIAQIWLDILRVPSVGRYDDFFDLGGHSLLAVRVVGRIRDTFGIELPMIALFEALTIEALSQQVDAMLYAAGQAQADSSSDAEDDLEEFEF